MVRLGRCVVAENRWTLQRKPWPGLGALGLNVSAAQSCRSSASDCGYSRAFAVARDDPETFWGEMGQDVSWFEPWRKTLHIEDPVFPNWFVGGKLNMCFNAVDRHVESGRGEQAAIIYDSPVTGTKITITFRELQDQVSRLAGVLVKNGVQKGDLVVIYMPMVPQAMFTMLACARIGAPHSLIFGGFASKELSVRIDHAKPKLLVTASFGIEPGRRVEYIPLVKKALEMSSHRPSKVLVYNRPSMEKVSMSPDLNLDWDEEMASARPHDCVPLPSNHPLYVLYTSGTTGTPKGVVRDTAGYAVMLKWTMSNIYGLSPGDVWWAASDLGWVVGHSYICYGPLLHGTSSVLYEGKPVGTPDPGQAGKPVPGYNVTVIDGDLQKVKPRTLGNIVVRLPLPPGAALSLWQNQDLFRKLYFTKFPGYYDTMDAGFLDEEGFLYIMSRSDDVINVAGHRLSAGALEESVLLHSAVGDCAVVGLEDRLKGHVPLALCVLKNGVEKTKDEITNEIVKIVRDTIGPVAAFRNVLFVRGLPKTRSGKIPRSSLASLVNGKPFKISPTIEDPDVFRDVERQVETYLRCHTA
uniref:Acyl-CoA synthetase short-chain family member 3, mitochondrial n=1 Tax=Nothobranchius kadleci TaxID=1051664 RepID=A0A1A8C7N9_NOTKA